jgi:hypothetical protein
MRIEDPESLLDFSKSSLQNRPEAEMNRASMWSPKPKYHHLVFSNSILFVTPKLWSLKCTLKYKSNITILCHKTYI